MDLGENTLIFKTTLSNQIQDCPCSSGNSLKFNESAIKESDMTLRFRKFWHEVGLLNTNNKTFIHLGENTLILKGIISRLIDLYNGHKFRSETNYA
jgi:hypothetical protein